MSEKLSLFGAPPVEIHTSLCGQLAEDVHLAYQQKIGAAAVREAANDLREQAERQEARAQQSGDIELRANAALQVAALRSAADWIDPDHGGGPWPSVLVRRFGHGLEGEAPVPEDRGWLAAYGRCGATTLRGQNLGVCDRPLDTLGRCALEGRHDVEQKKEGMWA